MGHLVTVQNVLTLLSAAPNLSRSDFPWDVEYCPFPLCLEPFSLASIAAYTFTEMPSKEELDAAPRSRKGALYTWSVKEGAERPNFSPKT